MDRKQKKALKAVKRKEKKEKRQRMHEAAVRSDAAKAIAYFKRFGVRDVLKTTTAIQVAHTLNYPEPQVVRGRSVPASMSSKQLFESLEKAMKAATFDSSVLGQQFSLVEYFSRVKPVVDFLRDARSVDTGLRSALAAAVRRLGDLGTMELDVGAIVHAWQALDEELIRASDSRNGLYYLDFKGGWNEKSKWQMQFRLEYCAPQTRTFHKSDGPRTAYRVGQPLLAEPIDWIELAAKCLGLDGDRPALPVYIQDHGLRRLYERLDIFVPYTVHEQLWQSLKEPKIASPSVDGKTLIEYRYYGYRLGYLVAQLLDEAVLIDSFLFITMDGTPESRKLAKQLRLFRADKQYLNLDELRTYVRSDLQLDTELVQLFDDCGCGDLFRMLEEPDLAISELGQVAAMRKHLGLQPSQDAEIKALDRLRSDYLRDRKGFELI